MSGSGERYVLDSYAVVAWLQGEPKSQVVVNLLEQASSGGTELFISVVNLGEVLYMTERKRSLPDAHLALATIDCLPIKQEDATRELALLAAHYKANHRMSFADAFAVALAERRRAKLVTGDPEMRNQKAVELVWIGPGDG